MSLQVANEKKIDQRENIETRNSNKHTTMSNLLQLLHDLWRPKNGKKK